MITAHYCPAYFLPPHHVIIIDTEVPFFLALIWGVVATFWMGAIFGAMVGTCAVAGRLPLLPFPRFKKMLIRCLVITFILAMVALIGVHLIGDIAKAQSTSVIEEDRRLVVAAVTHGVSYFVSAVSGIFLCIWAVVVRFKLARSNETAESR